MYVYIYIYMTVTVTITITATITITDALTMFITGGCSGRGVQWIGVVLCNEIMHNIV